MSRRNSTDRQIVEPSDGTHSRDILEQTIVKIANRCLEAGKKSPKIKLYLMENHLQHKVWPVPLTTSIDGPDKQ